MEASQETIDGPQVIDGHLSGAAVLERQSLQDVLTEADDRWEEQALDPAADVDPTHHGFTELRCHGVSGPLPGAVLGFPEDMVTQVWGNAYSGFWRRWMLGPTSDVPDQRRREAFCWGGLTSRAALQALWLLLLPFSLVNMAHWMLLPYRPGSKFVAGSAVVLLRLLALSLTGTLLLSGAEVTLDLGAWQCGAAAVCRPKLLPFGLMNAEGGWPGLRLGAAALLLAAVLLLLWRAGLQRYRPLQKGENAPKPTVQFSQTKPPAERSGRTKDHQPVLSHPQFWAVDLSTRWLRGLHVLFWCAGTGALLAAVLASSAPGGSTARGLGVGLAFGNLAMGAAVVVAVLRPERFGRGGSGPTSTGALRWLVPVGLVLLAGTVAATVGLLPGSADRGGVRLPWLQGAFAVVTLGQLAILVLLGCCSGWLALGFRRANKDMPPGYRPMLGGWLAFVVAFLSWFLALAYSAGLGLLAAGRWGTAVTVLPAASGKTLALLVPPAYEWIEVAAVATAAALVLGVVVAALSRLLPIRQTAKEIAAQQQPKRGQPKPVSYQDLPPEERAKARSAARIDRLAQSTELVPWLLAFAMAPVIVVAVPAIWRYYAPGGNAWFPSLGWLGRTASVGTWLATTGTAAAIALAYAAYRNQQTRRTVGMLWDVTTFWPRANHPMTPACTAERAVPQLVDRIGQLTTAECDALVLSAHSQGTVLGLAAVLRVGAVADPDQSQDADAGQSQGSGADTSQEQLKKSQEQLEKSQEQLKKSQEQLKKSQEQLEKLALLTFGSPLRRLYARGFPAYFSPEVLGAVHTDLRGRWLNLWAESDPIGAKVGAISGAPQAGSAMVLAKTTDAQMKPDPLTLGIDSRTGEPVGVCGHSGYVRRPAYEQAVSLLRQEIAVGLGCWPAEDTPATDVLTEAEPAVD